jgi:REP element-mobilizing transposase RayT
MAIVFVTWKLEGAAPEPSADLITKDDQPHRPRGPRWLADPRIARIVVEALHFGARRGRYELVAWSIMPNHLHVVILPKEPLSKIMGWLKKATAYRANQILDRVGQPFWMREYYDRWMRSDAEITQTSYAEDNPVRAGLVASPEQYRWSSAAGNKIADST